MTTGNSRPAAAKEPYVARRTKINRSTECFRPGLPRPDIGFRDLAIHFYFPVEETMGTESEWRQVRAFADQLRGFSDIGDVAEIGNPNGELKCVFRLKAHIVVPEDYVLTNAFLRLDDMLVASELIKNGLQGKPYWKAIKAGDFVADEGGFEPPELEEAPKAA